MRSGALLFLISLLFGSVSSKNEFPNEIIITSADLPNGVIQNVGKAGESYRLYGLPAAYTFDHNQTALAKITIVDSKGTTFKLTDLRDADSFLYSAFLNDTNIVVGPVTVTDPNPLEALPGLPALSRMPFVLYLVSTKVVPALPVVDAVTAYSKVGVNYNGQEVQGLTVLSADAFFALKQFELNSPAYIIPRGYDYGNNGGSTGTIMDLNQNNAYNSYLSVTGPIATIVNTGSSKSGRFKFAYIPIPTTNGKMSTDSTLTITSPNWLSLTDSYSTSWVDYKFQFDQQFSYGSDRHLDFFLSASNLSKDQNISIEVKSDNGDTKKYSYLPSTTADVRDTLYGNSISLVAAVDYTMKPVDYPRFILKVTSGASATSVIASLLLIFFSACH